MERIICCASRTLNKSEQNYSATKKEGLVVVWGIKNLRNYLIAKHFKVYTDRYSLQWLHSMKNESAPLHRRAAQLEDYAFEILHQPGKNQGHVDALSRLPMDKIGLNGHRSYTDSLHTKLLISRPKFLCATTFEFEEENGKPPSFCHLGSLRITVGFLGKIFVFFKLLV